MSKLHTADLYTRVLELQHQLDTQRIKIKKVEKHHKTLRKHFKTMESLSGMIELIEGFEYENSSQAMRIQHHLLKDRDIDLISAVKFIRGLKQLTGKTNELMGELL